jgi:hypothetical protein
MIPSFPGTVLVIRLSEPFFPIFLHPSVSGQVIDLPFGVLDLLFVFTLNWHSTIPIHSSLLDLISLTCK